MTNQANTPKIDTSDEACEAGYRLAPAPWDDLIRTLRDERHALRIQVADRARGNYEGRHPKDERLMPLSDINDLDEVCRELGIQDSHVTPAEAVKELNATIERLIAEKLELATHVDGCVNVVAEALKARNTAAYHQECCSPEADEARTRYYERIGTEAAARPAQIECPNCHNANEYGDYEGPTCEVCFGAGFIATRPAPDREAIASPMTPMERAERALFGLERGTHYGDDEKDVYAISRATLARTIADAQADAILALTAETGKWE